jgi:hypothetical protein
MAALFPLTRRVRFHGRAVSGHPFLFSLGFVAEEFLDARLQRAELAERLFALVHGIVIALHFLQHGRADLLLLDVRCGLVHASRYLSREGAEGAVRDGWYELLRNWALDTTLREALACETFVLVNLVRKRHETIHGENSRREFAERACLLSSGSQFAIAHWEDLIAAAPSISRHPDSDVLVTWARNKSELLGKPAFDL